MSYISHADLDELLRELMEEYRYRPGSVQHPDQVIYVYNMTYDRLVKTYAEKCTPEAVSAYHYLKMVVDRIAQEFGHEPPAVGIHNSARQTALYCDHDGVDPMIVVSIEEIVNHPIGAVWTILHEYMHYVQRKIGGYLKPICATFFEAKYEWKGREVVYDRLTTEHHHLPWEAEADSFANTNVGFFLSQLGYKADQFENPLPFSKPENVAERIKPNFNIEAKTQPEYWYYNSENSG